MLLGIKIAFQSHYYSSLIMKLALRLLKEFWLPTIIALLWTAYNVNPAGSVNDAKALVNIFAPTFFLASWATGQFFRVQKQAHVEENLLNIESRVTSLVSRLEKHTEDFMGFATGKNSFACFSPIMTSPNVLELWLFNRSIYPVFDLKVDVIDLDEPIVPEEGIMWTPHKFALESIYPSKVVTGAYRFSLESRESFRINVFIHTRAQYITQQIRIVRKADGFLIAVQTISGGSVIESTIPEDFPGFDPEDPNSIFG